ncbi:MAG: tetratricopeptide repeat protein [Candidatus Binatia bacterium]
MIAFIFLLLASSPLLEADSALKRGDYETATRLYRFHLEKEPSSYEALFGLARALAFSGKRKEAIEVYTDLLATHPDDADARLGRGRVFAWEGRFDEAEKDLRFVTERFPTYADAWSALGDLYLWSGRADLAVSAYTKWVELSPDEPGPYISRAKAHRDARRFSLAREELFSARVKGGDRDEIDRLLRELDRIPSALPWKPR